MPSLAYGQESEGFVALVDSMREHGYLKHFPIVEGSDGSVVDGRARLAAAEIAGVNVVRLKPDDRLSPRRDTPLHRALLMLDLNHGRLSNDDRQRVREAIAERVGREWSTIAADLARTQEWRRAKRKYFAKFDVKLVKYRKDDVAKVQVTRDGSKVALRSLLQAAGLANYKDRTLLEYVHHEYAQSSARPGPRAIFVSVTDAIVGIEALQQERRKVEPEWEEIRQWLIRGAGSRTRSQGPTTPTSTPRDDTEHPERETLLDSQAAAGQAPLR